MLQRAFLCLLFATGAGRAAVPDVLLGVSYSEWGPSYAVGNYSQMAADSSGALFILTPCELANPTNGPSCLTKYAPDGKTVVWQNKPGATVTSMAVDPAGSVYLGLSSSVKKLGPDGTVVWSLPITTVNDLKVDSTGRVFLLSAGSSVIRLTNAGAIDATISIPLIPGIASALAVDPTGSYILVAYSRYPSYAFALLGPTRPWETFTPPLGVLAPGISVAPGGEPVIYGTDLNGNRSLQRFDSSGAVVFTKAIPSQTEPGSTNEAAPGNLVIDAAGNAYITSFTASLGIPVKNSVAACGLAWLGVYAPDGSVLQITYLPGVTSTLFAFGLVAMGGSSVYVLDVADPTFSPSQAGPFPQYPYGADVTPASFALLKLSPNPDAQTLPLACIANAASFVTNAEVAPGELVTLYGNSLGPAEGISPQATPQTAYPTRAGGTQVTFDGKPAPLLWVQDSQVNAAVPWSVAGPTTRICVTYNDVPTNCLTKPVTASAPGVFTVDGMHAFALNQDGTLNSAAHPAPRNSIVAIWVTGLGPISPSQPDGSLVETPLPVNTYQPIVGTPACVGRGFCIPILVPAITTYAGPAPTQIAGMTQINFNLGPSPQSFFTVMAGTTPSGRASNAFQIYVAGQ